MQQDEPATNTWRNANRLAGGELPEILRTGRERYGESWNHLVARLREEYGIEVSNQTLMMWGRHLGIETSRTGDQVAS